MDRRHFLSTASLFGLATLIPKPLFAAAAVESNWQASFHAALEKHPQLLGHKNVSAEHAFASLEIEGVIPKDLEGTLYRNGPALFERGDERYHHLFEGDGMIRAFSIKNGGVTYRDKFVRTNKYEKETAAGSFLFDGPTTDFNNSHGVTSSDAINPANTSVISVGCDIWALWEGGSAHSIDTDTLEVKERVVMGPELEGMPFSAHPKIDQNGDIWNFGYSGTGHIILYRLSAHGVVKKVGLLNSNFYGMMHDFLITENYILIFMPPLNLGNSEHGYFNNLQFKGEKPIHLMVVDKNDFSVIANHDLPPGFIFHFGNGYEDKDGSIVFDACHYPNFDVMNDLKNIMKGQLPSIQGLGATTQMYRIEKTGRIREQILGSATEFPTIFEHRCGHKNKLLYSAQNTEGGYWFDSVVCFNPEKGISDKYVYGSDYLVEEHLPINRDESSGETGYLIGTALHWPSKRSCINIFNATDLKAGPIVRAWLPIPCSLGFHGCFIWS